MASAALDVASAIKADGACKEALESDCAAASDSENSNTSILDVENMLSKDNLDSDLNLSMKVSLSCCLCCITSQSNNVTCQMLPSINKLLTFLLLSISAYSTSTSRACQVLVYNGRLNHNIMSACDLWVLP